MFPHIAVLAGTDPVSIDQTIFDPTKKQAGKSLSELSFPTLDATVQLEYGKEIGLGSRNYWQETEF